MHSYKLRFLLFATAALVSSLPAVPSLADTVLYDNADLGNDTGIPVLGPRPNSNADRLMAQPFLTNENAVVTSARIVMQRLGSPSGVLHLDIYDDSSGTPGSQVARLGSFDITEIATSETSITAGDLSVALQPDTPYYLVLDNIDLNIPNLDNSYRVGMRTSNDGTFGAGRWLVTDEGTDDDWLVLGDLLPGTNYVRATVTAVPEPSSSVLVAVALSALVTVCRRQARQCSLTNINCRDAFPDRTKPARTPSAAGLCWWISRVLAPLRRG